MKTMKKLFALLLAVLMVMGMATTAMAETVGTITIKHAHEGHVYEAYQIFSGTLHGGILTDLNWGSGINMRDDDTDRTADFLEEIQEITRGDTTPLAGKTLAKDVAEVLSKWSKDDASLQQFADICGEYLSDEKVSSNAYNESDGTYTINLNEVGYYLVKDQAGTEALKKATATDYILQVVGNVSIEPKAVNPTFSKTVGNTLDGTYKEALSAEVGEKIYFKLESKMPSKLLDYRQYVLVFEETLPDELDCEKIEAVYIMHANGQTTELLKSGKCKNETTAESNTLKISTYNLLEPSTYPAINSNDTVVVKYSATLKPTVKTGKITDGGKGIVNKATLSFSNDMNQPYGNGTGLTFAKMTDTASVYTYGLNITKVSSADHNTKLKDAEFVLYRNVTDGNIETHHYAVLSTEDGMKNVIDHWTMEKTQASVLKSGEDGTFSIKGLGGISYNLEEIEPPQGYNTMDAPIVIAINPTLSSEGDLTALAGKADYTAATTDLKEGMLSFEVENTPGSTLPATGGIGTTIFYIVGGVLVLGAGAAFVMKKRNEA